MSRHCCPLTHPGSPLPPAIARLGAAAPRTPRIPLAISWNRIILSKRQIISDTQNLAHVIDMIVFIYIAIHSVCFLIIFQKWTRILFIIRKKNCFMATEAALWVVIICLTLPILKLIYAEVSKTGRMFYALVMNTVKLCIRQKKQMRPFSNAVNHMPLSEQRGAALRAGNTHSTLSWTSTYPLLHMCKAVSCPTTNLCQVSFHKKKEETTVFSIPRTLDTEAAAPHQSSWFLRQT